MLRMVYVVFFSLLMMAAAGCGDAAPAPVPAATGARDAHPTQPTAAEPPGAETTPTPTPTPAVDTGKKSPGAIVGIWNFDQADENGVIKNSRLGGDGVPAVLKEFDGKLLAGVDVELAPFQIVRDGKDQTVQVAKSGWATFKNIPDNGLNEGVHTPVGDRALALFAAQPGNWIHFPGLAQALVDHPGGATRTFGIAMWVLVQAHMKGDAPEFLGLNPLLRFCQTDGRFFLMPTRTDRLYTEDVGNGMGGGYGYQIPWARRDAATARWVHLTYSADGKNNVFQIWVNGEKVNYRDDKATSRPWPAGGGMQLNYKAGELSDGAVMGRWLGGAGAPGKTIGVAAVVILNGETISQARAKYLYDLGREGKKFDGHWPDAK